MNTNPDITTEQLFAEGVTAFRAGDQTTARDRLMEVVRRDQFHAQAWLWLSRLVETDEERIICLENVLTVEPHHALAQARLAELQAPPAPPPAIPAPAAEPPPATASTSEDTGWRAAIFEKVARDTGRSLIEGEDHRPRRRFADLLWAWIAAILLRRSGDYCAELESGDVRHIAINLALIVGLNVAFVSVLAVTLVIRHGGFAPLVEPAAVTLEEIGAMDTSFLIPPPFRAAVASANQVWGMFSARPFDRLFTWIGLRGNWLRELANRVQRDLAGLILMYALGLTLWTVGWQAIRAMLNNSIASWLLRGSGDPFQTVHALTTAQVAYLLIQLPFAAIVPFTPLHTTLRIIGMLAAYRLLLAATGLSTVHKIALPAALAGLLLSGTLLHIGASILMSGTLRLLLA